MYEFSYLKKLIDFLISKDPYSNVYAGWKTSLLNLEKKSNELQKKIHQECEKIKKN